MRLAILLTLSIFLSTGLFAQRSRSASSDITAYELRVFPNPATDSFSLVENDLVDKIVLYNIIGREVKTFDYKDNQKYSLLDLPEGMYFVSMINLEKGVLKTVRISKRAMRP